MTPLHEQIKQEIKRVTELRAYLLETRHPGGVGKLYADLIRAEKALKSNKTSDLRTALAMLKDSPDLKELKKWMKLKLSI